MAVVLLNGNTSCFKNLLHLLYLLYLQVTLAFNGKQHIAYNIVLQQRDVNVKLNPSTFG